MIPVRRPRPRPASLFAPSRCLPSTLIVAAGVLLLPASASAQDAVTEGGVRLMVGNTGIAIGHVPRVNGLRLNWSDRHLEQVNGVNLTFWSPSERVGGQVRGAALGLLPSAERVSGAGLGLAAVVSEEGGLRGLHAGGIAVVSGGPMRGFGAASLAVVSMGPFRGAGIAGLGVVGTDVLEGIQAAGLAVASDGGLRGFQAAGLAVITEFEGMRGAQAAGLAVLAEGPLEGFQSAGLAVVSQGSQAGVRLAGLAVVSGGHARGVQMGGLAVVARENMEGFQIGGGAVVAGGSLRGVQATLGAVEGAIRIEGLTVGGYRVRSPEVTGLTVAAGVLDSANFKGASIAGLHLLESSIGLNIGLVNWTNELRGVQLGLVNRAGNNPPPFRILPLVNARF